MDLTEIEHVLSGLACRGAKGTTGTQASYYELFKGESAKVRELEKLVAEKLGFERVVPVSGQTYTRKMDTVILNSLSGVAQSASKFAHDIRLLQGRHEIEEPFGRSQIGSSAMAYKRNPMRCERLCSLARHAIVLAHEAALTPAVQWFERSLDDSAGRRIYIPEAFLTADAILILWENVASGLVVYPRVIKRLLVDELPFMASEAILMAATTAGGNRQELHERLRQHAQAAAKEVLNKGRPNDFFARIEEDEEFSSVKKELHKLTDPMRFVGRAVEQVEEFLSEHVDGVLARLSERYGAKSVTAEV
jgi:adenylosuccinate lyase